MYATTLKTLAVVTYACLIVFTPEMPSYYTFSINTLGFTVTGFSTLVLLHFLNTRPSQQKNLLNRLLVLLVSLTFIATIRSYLLSVAACWFNEHLKAFVEAYPRLCISCMPLKHYSLAMASGFLAFSGGRLLLFVSPATFNNIKPRLWTAIAGISCVIISVVDSASHTIACSKIPTDANSGAMYILKDELGMANSSLFTDTKPENKLMDDTKTKCAHFPTLPVVLLVAILLEGVKVGIAVYRQVVQVCRNATIHPTSVPEEQPKRVEQRTESRVGLFRSETFPKISKSSLQNRRKNSLPLSQIISHCQTETAISLTVPVKKPDIEQQMLAREKLRKRIRTEVINLLRLLFIRSATFLTGFAVIFLFLLSLIFIMHHQRWKTTASLEANTVIGRIAVYVMNCVLIIYDKDILDHVKFKFNQLIAH